MTTVHMMINTTGLKSEDIFRIEFKHTLQLIPESDNFVPSIFDMFFAKNTSMI